MTKLWLRLRLRLSVLAVFVAVISVLPMAFAYDGHSTLAAKSGIGATGKIGEDALKALGGESQVYFRTSQGGRYVDQLVNGIAHESKVGYQSLTPTISRQIGKDVKGSVLEK